MIETISISGKLAKTDYGFPIVAGVELHTLFETLPIGAHVTLYITQESAQEASK